MIKTKANQNSLIHARRMEPEMSLSKDLEKIDIIKLYEYLEPHT